MELASINTCSVEEILKKYPKFDKDTYNLLNLYTFTIDSKEAKQYDDAISIIKCDDKYILFVHVADIISDINYHKKNSKKFKNFLYYHGNSSYENSNSLDQGNKRKALTLVASFNNDGELKDYQFIKTVINVDINLNPQGFEKKMKKGNITKEICNQLKIFCEFYGKLKYKIVNKKCDPNVQSSFVLLEEVISLYTHLLGKELIKKDIGKIYKETLIKKSNYMKNRYYLKATSPLYKGESFICQLLIHDFIINDRKDTLPFWEENKCVVEEFLSSSNKKKKNHSKQKQLNKELVI